MKKLLLIACLSVAMLANAQSGNRLFGKRFKTSLAIEVFPLIKGPQKIELNMPSLLKKDLYITPRFVLNNEYQVKRNMSLNLNIGFYQTALLIKSDDYYYDQITLIDYTPLNTTFVQFGLKFGGGGIKLPLSSVYYGFGLGFNFIHADEFDYAESDYDNNYRLKSSESLNSFLPSVYAETGRRIIFDKGILLEFGLMVNLSHALIIYSDSEINPLYGTGDNSFKQNMQRSVALSSFLNFRIAVGLLY